MTVEIFKLSNGLPVILDKVDTVQTVAMGVWCNVGSRFETPEISGISHFLEHMVFKGTTSRSALDISQEIESVGGSLNAYTSREVTGYHARVLSKDWKLATDILCDITLNATFDKEELERERGVILQEIGQTEDTPDDIIFDHFMEAAYSNSSVGRPVLGNRKSVSKISSEQLKHYLEAHYAPSSMVFCASGNIDQSQLIDFLESHLSKIKDQEIPEIDPAKYGGGTFSETRKLEQSHIVLGFKGVSYHDDDYYAMSILSMILGGGMSSRLFQEIREKRGLVYSIFSFPTFLKDGGLFSIYGGTSPEKAQELLTVTKDEIYKLSSTITDEEIRRAKNQLQASLLMGLESTVARCEHWAQSMLNFGHLRFQDEILSAIESVDNQQLQRLADKVFSSATTLATLGPNKQLLTF